MFHKNSKSYMLYLEEEMVRLIELEIMKNAKQRWYEPLSTTVKETIWRNTNVLRHLAVFPNFMPACELAYREGQKRDYQGNYCDLCGKSCKDGEEAFWLSEEKDHTKQLEILNNFYEQPIQKRLDKPKQDAYKGFLRAPVLGFVAGCVGLYYNLTSILNKSYYGDL